MPRCRTSPRPATVRGCARWSPHACGPRRRIRPGRCAWTLQNGSGTEYGATSPTIARRRIAGCVLWFRAGSRAGGTTVAGVSLHGVCKSYGDVAVVHGVDLEVADHEFVVFVGPSGCGKSTLLRMIAGLEDITAGEIAIDGRVVNELDPKDRDVAMVFQDYALYPHMTVYENMAFSLRYRGVARAEIRRRVDHAARILDIDPLAARMPRQLSGGQRQRVAMGRAIVRDPKVFLFDEPL